MSGCNCKSDKNIDSYLSDGPKSNEKLGGKISTYIFKSLAFIVMLAALPIINLFIIWFIFKMLILNKDVNIKPLLKSIGEKFKPIDSDDDSEYENLTEEDVVMVEVEDITKRSK